MSLHVNNPVDSLQQKTDKTLCFAYSLYIDKKGFVNKLFQIFYAILIERNESLRLRSNDCTTGSRV